MRLNVSVRRWLRFQHLLFLLLFSLAIGLSAWLSARYPVRVDWTTSGRNTLSEASQALLARLEGPVRVTAYVRDHVPIREGIDRLIDRYRRYKPDIVLTFVNPDLLPDQVRQLGIAGDGELSVEYAERRETLQHPSEQALTQVLQRLSRRQDRLVLFLDGHGERKPQGVANYDLGVFGRELAKIGIQTRSLDLAVESRIPDEAAGLVIASPQTPLSSDEIRVVLDYVQRGGNLLWLLEPADPSGLQALAALLGITLLPGVVVDADTPRLGIQHPAFIPIADYGPHAITMSLRSPALLPQAIALEVQPLADWQMAVLLESQSSSWTETGSLEGQIQFDPDSTERPGPLTVGVALFRSWPTESGELGDVTQQRLVIIGDGDFLSNTYLGNGANLALGLNILNWLVLDEALIISPPRAVPDPSLHLTESALALLAAFFLIILPAGLLASGWLIWFHRRRR
ncbi:MAG: GldG family protein [Gammaproteobacteria bacterium]|nr:GldG family protein [Gammaproteobacteria bacterium]MCP5195586.1 GldG family protein [Gammaproteobacteria bacterium]